MLTLSHVSMYENSPQTEKDLVHIAVEKTLSGIGNPTSQETAARLNEKYECSFGDCLEHPEYLKEILKEIYGVSHVVIIEAINKELEKITITKPIEQFMSVLNRV